MQKTYCYDDEEYLPYAFDPYMHFPMEVEKIYDACLIGLHYQHRDSLVSSLMARGWKVYYSIGEVYDQYRMKYNQSKIALSWSSMLDIPARVFEAMGMRIPLLANYVPDMDIHFVEGKHYFGFENLDEAIYKTKIMLSDYENAKAIAEDAYNLVLQKHTWDNRVAQILEKVGYDR